MEKKRLIAELDSKQRADIYIRDHTPLSRGQIQKFVENARVTVNGRIISTSNHKIKNGDIIEYTEDPPKDAAPAHNDIPLDILYEDGDILVINKQAGLVVHPAPGHADGTLVNAIIEKHINPEDFDEESGRLGVVHRLDKDTSGVMVIAKNEASCRGLVSMFKEREPEKFYKAIVHGRVEEEGKIETFIDRDTRDRKKFTAKLMHGKEAQTIFYPEEVFYGASLLKVKILTGRTHQIRVHMSHIKHPVAGDPVYGDRARDKEMTEYLGYNGKSVDDLLPRQMLHAYSLKFKHPATGAMLEFTAPLPDDFTRLLNMLRKKNEG
jgi:23S rRNA pseudouridine1911/1915/1917 synthase